MRRSDERGGRHARTPVPSCALALALAAAALSGCGGGGGSGGSASTAAAITTAQQVLPGGRAEHAAVFLPTGEVLVVGGVGVTGDPLAATVLVSPSSVRPGPDLAAPRVGHTATLLPSGVVLIAGGSQDRAGAQVLDTTEVFDPLTGTFAAGPRLQGPRARHVAAAWATAQGEQVLLAGGVAAVTTAGTQRLASAEVVDLAAGTSTPLALGLATPQADARVAALDTGAFLIAGGEGAAGPAPAALFDPRTRTFSPAPQPVARAGVALASRGREALAAGGAAASGVDDASEVFDAATGLWAPGVRLGVARRDAVATVVQGEVVVTGGRDAAGPRADVERLAGAALGQATVTAASPLAAARWAHTATALPGQKLVVVGGYDARGDVLDTIETLDLAASTSPVTTAAAPASLAGPVGPSMPAPGPGGLSAPPAPATTTATPAPAPAPTGGASTAGASGTTGSSGSSGGLAGILSGLLGGGAGSGGGSTSGTLLNAVVQSAIQALTSSSGGGFSAFMQAFVQNLITNLLGSGAGSGASGGLSGILSSLLGSLGGSGGTSSGSTSGLSGILSSLLGSLGGSGSSGSSSGGLSGLLSSLLGGSSSGSSGTSSGGLSGLLAGLLGGGSSAPAPSVGQVTPGQGRVGDTVLITGANFGATVNVSFNAVPAPIVASQQGPNGQVILSVTVPQGATTGAVTVTTGGATLQAGTFTVL